MLWCVALAYRGEQAADLAGATAFATASELGRLCYDFRGSALMVGSFILGLLLLAISARLLSIVSPSLPAPSQTQLVTRNPNLFVQR